MASSFAFAVALLAPLVHAQIGDWSITYQSLEANFENDAVNEITLHYLLGANRIYGVTLLDKNCHDDITGISIQTMPIPSMYSHDQDKLDVFVDLDKSSIVGSSIWDPVASNIEFCARVQLISAGKVITQDERNIAISFDFDIDFEVSQPVLMQGASLTSGSGTTNVDTYISACKCADFDSFECDDAPLVPFGILNVCLTSLDADVELAYLSSLELAQKSTHQVEQTMSIVEQNSPVDPAISAITIKNSTAWGIASVVPSSFFSYSGTSSATVSGRVQAQFVGSRKLISLGRVMRGDPDIIRPGYEDADAEETPFDLLIELQPNKLDEDFEVISGAAFFGWRAATIWMTSAALALGSVAIV